MERENPIPSPSPLLSTFAMQTTINYFVLTFNWRPLASTGKAAFLKISAYWADLHKSAENEIFTTERKFSCYLDPIKRSFVFRVCPLAKT